MSTFLQKKENIERTWYVVDATDKPVGRVATKVATILRGKHKPTYTPYVDCGDYVIVINADPGGLRERNAKTMIQSYPEEMMERAIKGMLPHNRLGRAMGKKLFVYRGSDHKHTAQKPKELKLD